jgi:hypothetical protein
MLSIAYPAGCVNNKNAVKNYTATQNHMYPTTAANENGASGRVKQAGIASLIFADVVGAECQRVSSFEQNLTVPAGVRSEHLP